jgi:hypothetical protein
MTVFGTMKIDLLVGAKRAGDDLFIRVHELAAKYGIAERHVREVLVEMHKDKLIRISAFHESGVVKPLEWWPDSEFFFNYASDGFNKRVRLLARGAEFLEQLSADESETPKRAIGFHG